MENNRFETIEEIAVYMADTVLETDIPGRVQKLEEEFAELMAELIGPDGNFLIKDSDRVIKEMGDVLFVLLHLANKLGTNGTELLHYATNKMFNRIINPNFERE